MTCDFQKTSQCFVRVEIYSLATVSCPTKFSTIAFTYISFGMQIELHSPEDVPVCDAALISLLEKNDVTKIYTVVETL